VRRADYARAAASALRDGGILLAVFFTNPENTDPHSPPFRCDMDDVEALFEKDFEFLETVVAPPTYPERQGRETLCLLRKKHPSTHDSAQKSGSSF
jgi:hypothetical protein